MGGTSSRISSGTLASPQTYAQAAAVAKQLPDEILRLMFASADFKDLLELSSISGCSKYVFTTAKSLSALFTTLNVEPQEQEGQILFAPIPELIPGVKKNIDAEEKQRISLRNNLCLKIAYYYVRIFQVYAALALSVLDTNPTRTMSVKETSRLLQMGQPKGQPQGPRKAVFQSGGADVNPRGESARVLRELKDTDYKLLEPYISKIEGIYIFLSPLAPSKPGYATFKEFDFRIQWEYTKAKNNQLLDAYLRLQKDESWTTVKIQAKIDGREGSFTVNGIDIGQFSYIDQPPTPGWYPNERREIFLEKLMNYAIEIAGEPGQRPGVPQQAQRGAPQAARPAAQQLYGAVASGKPSFEKFDDVKRVFEKRLRGDDFPKAYAVGRAMILLQPIFANEKTKQTPFFSQICRRVYDFDPQNFMPRSGVIASANIYMKSLVALYYDDFKLVGAQPVFSQTETGASELRMASQQIAKLFRIDRSQNTFISTAQIQFAQHAVCTAKGGDVLLQIVEQKKPLLLPTIRSVIAQLLFFQDQHNQKVNALLKKMFIIKNKELIFTDALKKGGIDGVNVFAREARELLRQYYLKSEALFTMGVLAFDDYQNEVTGLKVS